METRNIMVAGVWAFALVWLVGMLVLRGDLLVALIIFFIAVGVSLAAVTATPSAKKSFRGELRGLVHTNSPPS
jgi:hypothetical protein